MGPSWRKSVTGDVALKSISSGSFLSDSLLSGHEEVSNLSYASHYGLQPQLRPIVRKPQTID